MSGKKGRDPGKRSGQSTNSALPRREIRYLAGEGIHPREIKGISQLDMALPADWTFYAGLQYFPGHETPIEMDLIILMDDRVLLVEIKDWTKKIRSAGSSWVIGRGNRRQNPVKLVASKARKLKTLIQSRLPHIPAYVDSCVVLTATSHVADMPAGEARHVLSLAQACRLGDSQFRRQHLATVPLTIKVPALWNYASDFDNVFGDDKVFRTQEANFDGYRIVEAKVFEHPLGVWSDHRAEATDRTSSTALLRSWNFAKLPPALNSPDTRAFVAGRERRVFSHLNDLGSWLADGSSLLRPQNAIDGEVHTNHFDLLSLPATWAQLPRFVERARENMEFEEALDLVGELLRIAGELHDRKVAHRDIGRRNVWLGGPSRVGLTGFAICQLPTDESVADWRSTLQAYAPPMPEDEANSPTTGFRRDVYQLGMVAKEIIDAAAQPSSRVDWLTDWLATATAPDSRARYPSAREMADELARHRSEHQSDKIGQSRLDSFETKTNPYAAWPTRTQQLGSGSPDVYRSVDPTLGEIVVKVWPGMRRGSSVQTDLALLRLLEGTARLITSPLEGFPIYEQVGLHAVGPFVVYRNLEGENLPAALDHVSFESAVSVTSQLLRAINALHGLGYSHGDLSPKNILVEGEDIAARITILDLFDITPVGAGGKKSLAYSPLDHETCGDLQIDRYAVALVARQVLERFDDRRLDETLSQLNAVIESGGATPLEFAMHALGDLNSRGHPVSVPEFTLHVPDVAPAVLDQRIFLVRTFPDAIVLTEEAFELSIRMNKSVVTGIKLGRPSYPSLEDASLNGKRLQLTLKIEPGELRGHIELADYIRTILDLPRPASLSGLTDIGDESGVKSFPVRAYWQRVIDLEEDLLPELEITGLGETLGRGVTYPCDLLGGAFDFDPLDTVDVYIGERERPIANFDPKHLTENSVTFSSEADWPLKKGDRVRLVSRRNRQSFDRRKRAVENILRADSQIPDLIEYFDPSADKQGTHYDVQITETDLVPYELNEGQRHAMLRVLRQGPVGLVQGPPGTGKTHFIAALVHWLTQRGGSDKILLVSQSHEAVNAALETLIDRFKAEKNALPLLRIGTKGITEKIRPYHTDSLRERFRTSFDGAFKQRVAVAARGAGVSRSLAYSAVDIDRQLAAISRRLSVLESSSEEGIDSEERRGRDRTLAAVRKMFERAGYDILGRPASADTHVAEVAAAYEAAVLKADATAADLKTLLSILTLAQNWTAALSTKHRNFDEFLVKTRSIVAGTCVGVGQTSLRLEGTSFDWVIIDEAARCTSGELSVAAQLGRRILLVGDHLQLLPMSDAEMLEELRRSFPGLSDQILARSDFERAFGSSYGTRNRCVLSEQYRMAAPICDLIADTFYRVNGVELQTSSDRKEDPSFGSHLPAPLNVPIAWLDTSADQNVAERSNEKWSKANDAEVRAVIGVLDTIAGQSDLVAALADGAEENPIGIICMYGAQRDAIQNAVAERPWDLRFRRLLKVDTVDSYQGKENKIVIVSLSRTNRFRQGGHVSVPNRANVAFSRAKERLVVVGSARFWAGFSVSNPIRKTLDWVRAREAKDGAARVFDAVGLFRK